MKRRKILGFSRCGFVAAWTALCLAAGGASLSRADEPIVEWEVTLGGPGREMPTWVEQTRDGGYVVVGKRITPEPRSIYLVKVDANGIELWERTFQFFNFAEGACVRESADRDLAIAGTTVTPAGPPAVCLLKTDDQGNELWRNTPGLGQLEGGCYGMQVTADLGFVVTGSEIRDTPTDWQYVAFLMKTDASGNVTWIQSYDPDPDYDGETQGFSVDATSDGGFIVAGSYEGPDELIVQDQIWLLKTDSRGREEWSKTFGGPGVEQAHSVETTRDGGYIVAGDFDSPQLLKTDTNGNQEWMRTYGAASQGWAVDPTADGGYVFLCTTRSEAGAVQFLLVKTDAAGHELWSTPFGREGVHYGDLYTHRCSLRETRDGGYIVVGSIDIGTGRDRHTDIYLVKLAPGGLDPTRFRRGDANANGLVTLDDAVSTLNYLFRGEPPAACADAADADDSGSLELTDAVFLLNHLFRGGAALPEPGSEGCGPDPTVDELSCESLTPCEVP